MDETERRAGLYVMTRGTRVGSLVSEVSLVAIASERGMSLTRPISWLITRGTRYSYRLVGVGGVFGSQCVGTRDAVNASYLISW